MWRRSSAVVLRIVVNLFRIAKFLVLFLVLEAIAVVLRIVVNLFRIAKFLVLFLVLEAMR
jgi:hypothetical protein